MRIKSFIISLITALILTGIYSCKKNEEEELRKKENEALKEYLSSTKLSFYKAIKVALRSYSDSAKHPEITASANHLLYLAGIGGSMLFDSTKKISLTEAILLARDFYKAKDELNSLNEDDLPTVLENLGMLFSRTKKFQVPDIFGMKYDNNFEHVMLGILWTASAKAPKEFLLYELDRANENKISSFRLKLFTQLCKTLAYSLNEFQWHALDESDAYLKDLDGNKERVIGDGVFPFGAGENGYYEMHLLGSALRGISKLELEKEEDAMKDFEMVLDDAEKCGMDDEITWLIGLYVHTKKEENEKAIADIDKLLKSDQISDTEKEALREGRSYLEKKENGKAFNSFRDKVALWKIEFNYARRRLKQIKELQEIEKTKEGKRLLEIQKNLDENSEYIDKISNGVNSDSLGKSAKNLVKDIFNK